MRNSRCGVLTATVCVAAVTLAACGREGQDEMSWARAALERNGAIEVVAADQQSRTFTVRVKDTGELRVLPADQVVASPPGLTGSNAMKGAAPAAPAPPAPAVAEGTAAPAASPPEATASDSAATAAPAVPVTQPSALAPRTPSGEEDTSGRMLVSGPGFSIKAAAATADGVRAAEGGGTSAAPERRHEPIVCQGSRLVHIDNRNLVFDGDAVSAEDGCEIHITNSRITATGVGVSARAANVHIDNSLIEGDQAAIDASQGAQVYAESSRFKGLSRRVDSATVHDLGGNVWN
jgi:uncharacterized Zn-binding protein involved in type VI secretion